MRNVPEDLLIQANTQINCGLHTVANPVYTLLCARTGPILGRCWPHRPSTGPVLACLQSRGGIFIVRNRLSGSCECARAIHHMKLLPQIYIDTRLTCAVPLYKLLAYFEWACFCLRVAKDNVSFYESYVVSWSPQLEVNSSLTQFYLNLRINIV